MTAIITAEEFDFPALKLGEILGVKGNGTDSRTQPSGFSQIDHKVEFGVVVGLVVEVVDGLTVRYVPVDTAASIRSRLGREEAQKIPSVSKALKVPFSAYIGIQEPAQQQIGHVLFHGADPDGRQVRLTGLSPAKLNLKDVQQTPEPPQEASDAPVCSTQPLNVSNEDLEVAAAASLSDLVLGRVLLIRLQGRDASNKLVGRLLLPAVCDTETEGRATAYQLYWRLAGSAKKFDGKIRNKECPDPSCIQSTWKIFSTEMQMKSVGEILNDFLNCNFGEASCPRMRVLTDVGDVMVSRGLALVPSDIVTADESKHKRLMALQVGTKWNSRGIWGIPLIPGEGLPARFASRYSGDSSNYPALFLSQLLECQSGGTETFFAALVIKIDKGDTVHLLPVVYDQQVDKYFSQAERNKLASVKQAMSNSTKCIIDCPVSPRMQLPVWKRRHSRALSTDTWTIEAQLYGIKAPEINQENVQKTKDQNLSYGSKNLDQKGQPLGHAASRALSELLLGRVVLVQDLARDCHQRMVARILVPTVTDRLADGKNNSTAYFNSLHERLSDIVVGTGDLPYRGGAMGLGMLMQHLCGFTVFGNALQALLLKALDTARLKSCPVLLDASTEMLRRGLAILDEGEDVLYADREVELRRAQTLAQKQRSGIWDLPAACRLAPRRTDTT